MHISKLTHSHREIEFESILLTPTGKSPYPAVVLFHEYTGLSSTVVEMACPLVQAGFLVLCADLYGIHDRPENIAQAQILHKPIRGNKLLMRARAVHCMEQLKQRPETDQQALYAVGFSFGGGAVMELVRSNYNFQKAVSFYGYLETTEPAQKTTAELKLIHVENDPVVPESSFTSFKEEFTNCGASYHIESHSNLQHGFMNPDNPAYSAKTAHTFWERTISWLKNEK